MKPAPSAFVATILAMALLAAPVARAAEETHVQGSVTTAGGATLEKAGGGDPGGVEPALPGLDYLIDARLGQPELHGTTVSVLVRAVDGTVLYEREADLPLVPASNMKIVTGACALAVLGGDYRFATDVGTDGVLAGGAVSGNLYVRGSGDPAFVSEELWKLCERLRARGVRRIDGDIVLDDSRFDGVETSIPESGDGDRAYHARTSALSLNFNTVAVHVYPGDRRGEDAVVSVTPDVGIVDLRSSATTGSSRRGSTIEVRRELDDGANVVRVIGRVPEGYPGRTFYRNLDDPTGCFGIALEGFLMQAGIETSGDVRRGEYPEDARLLHRHESKPLSLIVSDLGKYSNNFVAEQLLKAMSFERGDSPGTSGGGVSVLTGFLLSRGVPEEAFHIADGSGYSRDNRLTTRAITTVLSSVCDDFETAYEFVAGLSIGGVDGTLGDRMGFPGLKGMVRAKTGLLDGVTAVSGLLYTVAGDVVVFSIITNGSACEAWRLHDLEHEILTHLAREIPRLGRASGG